MKTYELIEHTADIGVRVRGRNLKELFRKAALAMFDIIGHQVTRSPGQTSLPVKIEGQDLEELFVNWLNELLSLSSVKELIFSDFKFSKIENNGLEATAVGEDTNNYKLNTEIKAATYHQLKIEETKSGWQAEVIFDV